LEQLNFKALENAAKRLDTPLPLLNRDSKVLKRKKEKEPIPFGGWL